MIGRTIGHYEVTGFLGEGGMGKVYRARDTRLGRDVALKVLPAKFVGDEERTSRFRQEARLLARLNHPNVAQVFGLETGEGVLALAMEFVDGQTLAERMAQGAMPLEETVSIARQVAEAIEHAHEAGVIHRDLKPHNVKITAHGRVKVLDFGLARALASVDPADAAEISEAPTLSLGKTRSGTVMGTASYMAPEQARGEEVDRRADIWSFGVILCEMLSGRRLFDEPSFAETISAVLSRPLDLDRLLPSSPPALRALARRCLERNPKRRLRDIGEARVALEDVAGAPEALPEPVLEDDGAPRPPSVAVLPFVNMSADPENEYFADGITEDVIAHLAKIRTLRVTSRTSVMAFKRRERNLREIGATLGVGAILEGSVRRSRDRVRIVAQLIDPRTDEHLWAESYDRNLDDIFAIQTDVALQIANALQAELTLDERTRINLPPTRDLVAYQLLLVGRHHYVSYTREGFTRAIAVLEQAIARDPDFALAYAALANAHTQYSISGFSGVEPAESFRRCQQAVDRALALDNRLAEAHTAAALLRMARDFDWAGAEAGFRKALSLSPGHADVYDQLGWLCSAQVRFDESLALFRRARELDPLAHRSDYANELLRAGRAEEAIAEAEASLAIDPSFSRSHSVRGWACITLGRTAEGVAALERAAELSPGSTLFRAQLAEAYAMTGREAEAQAILAEIEALAAREYVAANHIAYIHTGLGDHETAIDWLERAVEQRAGGVFSLKGSYLFAPLRSHPRFQALLRRMNL